MGPRFYELEGGRLRMTGKAPFKNLALDVDLNDIVPHFVRIRVVAFRFIRNCIMCIVAIVLLMSLLSHVVWIPSWVLVGGAVLLSSGFVRGIFKWSRPIELEQLNSQAGLPILEIWREKGQEREFDAFIEALREAVNTAHQNGMPNQSSEPTLSSVTPPAGQESRPR